MANTLIVSFEIKWEEEDGEYQKIWAALQTAIRKDLALNEYWSETTSYYVIETGESSATFIQRVWQSAGMRKSKDILIVLNSNGKHGSYRGAIKDQTIFTLLPFLKEV